MCEVEEVELLDKRGYLTICLSLAKDGKVYLRKTEGIREWHSNLRVRKIILDRSHAQPNRGLLLPLFSSSSSSSAQARATSRKITRFLLFLLLFFVLFEATLERFCTHSLVRSRLELGVKREADRKSVV